MKNRVPFLLLLLLVVPALIGCPGNRKIDKEANDNLWAWVVEQDTGGWEIPGFPDSNYQNIVVDHQFRPTRLDIAITGDSVNNLHQRNILDMIAMKWLDQYPANMRPRFNLRVSIFDQEIDKDNALGYTEIDQDGSVDTHHHATHDVI